jgi:hypothetical protein
MGTYQGIPDRRTTTLLAALLASGALVLAGPAAAALAAPSDDGGNPDPGGIGTLGVPGEVGAPPGSRISDKQRQLPTPGSFADVALPPAGQAAKPVKPEKPVKPVRPNVTCDLWGCGLNHNEAMVRSRR